MGTRGRQTHLLRSGSNLPTRDGHGLQEIWSSDRLLGPAEVRILAAVKKGELYCFHFPHVLAFCVWHMWPPCRSLCMSMKIRGSPGCVSHAKRSKEHLDTMLGAKAPRAKRTNKRRRASRPTSKPIPVTPPTQPVSTAANKGYCSPNRHSLGCLANDHIQAIPSQIGSLNNPAPLL